jgi:hypothetical protein
MGSLLSKSQKEEENRQDNAWNTRDGKYETGQYNDWYGNQGGIDWMGAYAGQGQFQYDYSNIVPPSTEKTRVLFTAAEVQLNMGKVVYCSGPHRNADSTKAFTKDSHKTERKPSEIEISIHYFEPGHYQTFKMKKIKRWTSFKFDRRRRFPNGSDNSEADVIRLIDARREKDYIEMSWREFISNFTPFSEEQSKPQMKGSYFDTASWTVNSANQKPSRLETVTPAPLPAHLPVDDYNYHHHHSRR